MRLTCCLEGKSIDFAVVEFAVGYNSVAVEDFGVLEVVRWRLKWV